jgi:D-3-phosphoglycerate dehydrogenase
MYKVLISDKLHPQAISWLESQSDIEVRSEPGISTEDLLNILSNYDALIVRSRTKVRIEEIKAGTCLKVIGRAGAGLDNIDLENARESGIEVVNSPGANANAVAELVIALILALARRLPSAFVSLEKPKEYGWELSEKTLGVLGLGQIGGRVARLGSAFGMNLLGYDVDPTMGPSDVEYRRVDFEAILSMSDVITLHVPILDSTRGLVSTETIEQMKDGVTIINAARAGIADESDILKGITSGKIQGYAADAIESDELRAHPQVIHTPHIGAQTKESQLRTGMMIAERVATSLRNLSS